MSRPDPLGELALREAKRLEKLLEEHFASVRRRSVCGNANHAGS
jgi:hypothetical protein